jgi:hypothetical protein
MHSGLLKDNNAGLARRVSVETRERHSGEWRSRARRKTRKHYKFSCRATDYFAAGGGATTAVILRIIPSDLLKT